MVPSALPGSFVELRVLADSHASYNTCSAALHRKREENDGRRCSLQWKKQQANAMDLESGVSWRNAVATAGMETIDLHSWFELDKRVRVRTAIGMGWG